MHTKMGPRLIGHQRAIKFIGIIITNRQLFTLRGAITMTEMEAIQRGKEAESLIKLIDHRISKQLNLRLKLEILIETIKKRLSIIIKQDAKKLLKKLEILMIFSIN